MKILISYGGSFKGPQSPPTTAEEGIQRTRYHGGETRIICIDRRGLNLRKLHAKVSALIPGALLSLPSESPGLWLSHQLVWAANLRDDGGLGQVLVPILDDSDVILMIAEHDRLVAMGKPGRPRVFLCDSQPFPGRGYGVMDSCSSSRTAFLGRRADDLPSHESPPSSYLSGTTPNVSHAITTGNSRKRTPEIHPAEGSRPAIPHPTIGGSIHRGRWEHLKPSIRLRTEIAENIFSLIPGRRPPLTIKLVHGRRTASNPPPSNLLTRSRCGDAAEADTGRLFGYTFDTLPIGIKKAETLIPTETRKLAHRPTQQIPRETKRNQSPPDKGTDVETDRVSFPGGEDYGNQEEHRSPTPKADTEVQAGISAAADTSEEFPAVCSHLATGQLQTIKNTDLEEIRELGSGSFGTVFHGKWKGSDVAIKRIKPSCFSEGDTVGDRLIADFWKEAHLLAQLHHPNLVSFYGVVTDGPGTSIATVTEFMVNGSLRQILRRKDRTIDRRKRLIIAMDAAFGMEYLHEKGVVHFDLKSHNLLVNIRDAHRPICKIGDLGLSKVKRRTLVSGGVRGTILWMAPELLNPNTDMVTDKIDVYSFGIVMWELLTGEEPYEHVPPEEVIGGIIKGELRPEIPSWCEPTWRSLMERCWAVDPAVRPPFSQISKELRAMAAAMNIL